MLLHLVLSSRTTFEERQKRKAKKEEIEVKNLDHWRPADLLSPVLQLPESHG